MWQLYCLHQKFLSYVVRQNFKPTAVSGTSVNSVCVVSLCESYHFLVLFNQHFSS